VSVLSHQAAWGTIFHASYVLPYPAAKQREFIVSKSSPSRFSGQNRILAALPHQDYEHLLPALKRVRLDSGAVLCEIGDVMRQAYFPLSGIISLLSITEDGSTIEVAAVGNEGMIGLPLILGSSMTPYRVLVQLTTDVLKIAPDALAREFRSGGNLHKLLLHYTHTLLCQLAQSAVCHRFHTVEQRLCRWLLASRDRVHSDRFPLTQELISHMLGIPRTNVTMTAQRLQRKNLIRYKRGEIIIVDQQGLETASCECYRVVKAEVSGFLDP
jgi:CRP-like cAMP-binding protein